MGIGRSVSSALGLAFVVMTASRCSNVTGSGVGSGGPPGCPMPEGGADSGGDDAADGSTSDDGGSSPCKPPDSDGITGGCYVFDVTVDDTSFSPAILKAQNNGQVTLTLKNVGTKPHDFAMGCVPISYPGCSSQFCFPAAANIVSLAPGAMATTTFVSPYVEGIYDFRSDLPGDSQMTSDGGIGGLRGQFVIQ